MVFKFKKLSLHFQCLSATLHQRGISQGQILNSFLKQLSKYTSLILQFYFHSTKMTLPFNSKQSKWLNKYFKRYFLEIQVMRYTQVQEKVGFLQISNLRGKMVLLNSTHWKILLQIKHLSFNVWHTIFFLFCTLISRKL